MKTRLACTIICLITCSFVASVAACDKAVRTFEFTYIAEFDDIPVGAKKVSIWLPYPKSNENQKITPTRILAPYPVRIYRDSEYGNSILYLSTTNPKCNLIRIEMKFRVKRHEYIRRDFDRICVCPTSGFNPMVKRWLQPDRLVPMDDRIKKLAEEVTQGKITDIEKARAIYQYVIDTMSYDKSGTGWGRGDIHYACDVKRGNCTDFHSVFIGLCRAVGIPAKFAIGFSLPSKRGQGEIEGYHCWAEFYLKDYGWIPVDASEASNNLAKKEYFFGAHDENRVQFTVGRDIILNPPQTGEPQNYFIYLYVEVDGKPSPRVQKKFMYRDFGFN